MTTARSLGIGYMRRGRVTTPAPLLPAWLLISEHAEVLDQNAEVEQRYLFIAV